MHAWYRLVPVVGIVVLISTVSTAIAAPAGDLGKLPTTEIKDTKRFFEWFFAMRAKSTTKGEIETTEQFKKRLPPPFNSNKTIYFVVKSSLGPDYEYEADEQKLTVRRGDILYYIEANRLYKRENGPLEPKKMDVNPSVVIASEFSDKGSYTGTTAFGATSEVTIKESVDYVLCFYNTEKWSRDFFDAQSGDGFVRMSTIQSGGFFRVSFSIPPAEAKRLAENVELIVGVRLLGYQRSIEGQTAFYAATIDSPSSTTLYAKSIDAYLCEVIIRDKQSGKVYFKHAVPAR